MNIVHLRKSCALSKFIVCLRTQGNPYLKFSGRKPIGSLAKKLHGFMSFSRKAASAIENRTIGRSLQ